MTLKQGLTALIIGTLLFSITSCIAPSFTLKSSNSPQKKRHPHGGPPGQTKKHHNKSRKHLESFDMVDFSFEK